MDVVSLSTGVGHGLPNAVAPVPSDERLTSGNKAKKEESPSSAAYEITLSDEAKELLARMEGSVHQVGDVRFEDLLPAEQNRIRDLERQLTEIFGEPSHKKLSTDEKEQLTALRRRMSDVLGFAPKSVDPMHHNLVQRLEEEAGRMLADPQKIMTENEERQLAVVFSHLESLQGVSAVSYQVPTELADHIDALQGQVDQISGVADIKMPSASDMKQATQIFQDLVGIYDGAFKRMMKVN
ncbi:hypothetical protein WH96_02925 [Kiloniella spongiae]|uniref:Uncharacterized protein n=2 Tax=Kiloniella spongiae TaxID=1489064 RepID=A0A0H2MNY6_9PROT|nr:hypothetical protein WH96_02925 [Kiloniella spongiae]